MSNELKKCPCGKVPDELFIAEGSTFRWRYVSGNCCGEWAIEARVESGLNDSEGIKHECMVAWNDACRG